MKEGKDIIHDQQSVALNTDLPRLPFKGFQYPMHDSKSHYLILTMPQKPSRRRREVVWCSQDVRAGLKLHLENYQNICRISTILQLSSTCIALDADVSSFAFERLWMSVVGPKKPNASDLFSLMETGLLDLLKAEITCSLCTVHLPQNRGCSLAGNNTACRDFSCVRDLSHFKEWTCCVLWIQIGSPA